jgi:ubiquinone/menaquinone biosynthesis C-methylase UbiE
MSTSGKVEAYFSGVAASYQAASKGGIWSAVRQREARRLMSLVGDVTGADVLELGSGAGFYTRLLLAAGARHVWAVDLSQPMLDELPKAGVTAVLGDATLVDPGRTFRTLLSAGMLEFVPEPLAALRNAARLAEPGASLYVLFPRQSFAGRLYQRFHARNGLAISLFDEARLRDLAGQSGWRVAQLVPAGPYSACAAMVRLEGRAS